MSSFGLISLGLAMSEFLKEIFAFICFLTVTPFTSLFVQNTFPDGNRRFYLVWPFPLRSIKNSNVIQNKEQ